VEDAITDQLGIKPEEVTWKQITSEMADLLRDYPALTLVPAELAPSQPSENTSQPDSTSPEITLPSSNTRLDPKERMPTFRWDGIDHKLVSLRLTDLAEEMRAQIEADERRIRFENHGNLNRNAVPSLVLKMKQDRADDMARSVYEIYCNVWQTQGHAKSAAFLRAVYLHGLVPVLRGRTGGIASEFAMFATRTSFPVELGNAHLQSLRRNMHRLESRWHRRIEIEAKELEHAERTAPLAQQEIQRRNVATKKAAMGITSRREPTNCARAKPPKTPWTTGCA
jgi:hypothetical protein